VSWRRACLWAWGQPLFDKLDADIAYAMMGLNAVKGVEIGAGFASVAQRGTTHGDSLSPQGFLSNNAGGVLGGMQHRARPGGEHRHQAHQSPS
jgi:chorismate synthase